MHLLCQKIPAGYFSKIIQDEYIRFSGDARQIAIECGW